MVSWKIFREQAAEVMPENVLKKLDTLFEKSNKEVPSNLGDALFNKNWIDRGARDLLKEVYRSLKRQEDARTVLEQDAETEGDSLEDLAEFNTDRYKFLENIGEGGMGTVDKYFDDRMKQEVAVKTISAEDATDDQKKRFLREIRLTSQMEREHRIIRAKDLGMDEEGNIYFVMDFVPGTVLTDYVENAGKEEDTDEEDTARTEQTDTYSLKKLVELLAESLGALSTAHNAGIIHRDIKPDNIMVDGRNIKLMDFGIAKKIGQKDIPGKEIPPDSKETGLTGTYPDGLTGEGWVLGTPRYMSPEQAEGQPADTRADIYAMGAILYEILTGESPNKGNSGRKIIVHLVNKNRKIPKPSHIKSRNFDKIPAELESICMKALENNPAERYQTAKEMAADLSAFLNGEKVSAHKYSVLNKVSRFIQRHTTAAASAFLIITALGVGGIFYQTQQAATARAEARAEKEAKEKAETEAELQKKKVEEQRRKVKEAKEEVKSYKTSVSSDKVLALALAGNLEDALTLSIDIVEKDAENKVARFNRSIIYYELSVKEQNPNRKKELLQHARQDIDFATQEDTKLDTRMFLRMKARIYEDLGETEKARQFYEQGLRFNTDDFEILLDKAKFHARQKEWEFARDAFSGVIQLNPKNASAHYGIIDAYMMLNDVINAERHARILTEEKIDLNAWLILSRVLFAKSQITRNSEDRKAALIEAMKNATYALEVSKPDSEEEAKEVYANISAAYKKYVEKK